MFYQRHANERTAAMRFNVNDHVKVKLTDVGRRAIVKNHERLFGARANQYPMRKVDEDADGWSRWQLWDLMQEFGPHIVSGCHPPFETTIEIEVKETAE